MLWPWSEPSLTLQAVSVQKLLAFLVHFDPALRTAHALPSDAPQQTLALVAVRWRGGGPHLKVVWGGAGDGVDESLQSFLVYVVFLLEQKKGGQDVTTVKCSESEEKKTFFSTLQKEIMFL